MRRAPAFRTLSGILLLVVVTLSIGLPSHHHGGDLERSAEVTPADHHDHGVILTEQATRLPSTFATAVALPAVTLQPRISPIVAAPEARPPDYTAPHERPPPSSSPRAPPVAS